MTKRQFLAKLEKELSKLNKEERERQLDFYEEMINDRIDEGMSEEEAVKNIGTVQGIAAKVMDEVTPQQLRKKKIGRKGWICIALAALLLIGAAAVAAEIIEEKLENEGVDIDDLIEDRVDLDGGWLFGSADAEFEANDVHSIDVVWASGEVTVDEAEGRSIVVKAGDDEALEYQIKNGTLYISNTDDFDGKADLKVLIPEDIMQLDKLNVVTGAYDVSIDGEYFADINVVAAGGTVRLNPDEAANVSISSANGDVILELDEDDAFVMSYTVDGGDVSVGFDRSFVNESGNGEAASYDHSFGRANSLNLNISVTSGDIKLIDD